jgi:hypothetical protein
MPVTVDLNNISLYIKFHMPSSSDLYFAIEAET